MNNKMGEHCPGPIHGYNILKGISNLKADFHSCCAADTLWVGGPTAICSIPLLDPEQHVMVRSKLICRSQQEHEAWSVCITCSLPVSWYKNVYPLSYCFNVHLYSLAVVCKHTTIIITQLLCISVAEFILYLTFQLLDTFCTQRYISFAHIVQMVSKTAQPTETNSLHSKLYCQVATMTPRQAARGQLWNTSASPTSAKCNLVRKPYTNLQDTPVALASVSKHFQMLPAPPGALQSALRLCKSILTCSWKHLQWWRRIQADTRFDY